MNLLEMAVCSLASDLLCFGGGLWCGRIRVSREGSAMGRMAGWPCGLDISIVGFWRAGSMVRDGYVRTIARSAHHVCFAARQGLWDRSW